jgi:adenosylcobinamide kinase/adenosylcobinamide-phosphate guanylyltransferase
MRVLVEGSGGWAGWPQPGCRCASCGRQAAAGNVRKRSTIVVDGRLWLGAGDTGTGDTGTGDTRAGDAAAGDTAAGDTRAGDTRAGDARAGDAAAGDTATGDTWAGDARAEGYLVRRLGTTGWEVTAPDGGRLLYPAGPGPGPVPPEGAAPYDVAFLDLLGDPAQLGWLRARGLITAQTVTVVAFADHRVASERELAQRCGFWRVRLASDGETIDPLRSDPTDLDPAAGSRRVLVLGGARSGKSERAELRLAGEPDVTYVATGGNGTGDPEWAARVAAHRARRPAWWRTAETSDLADLLGTARGALLIDGIGTWLAAVLDECGAWDMRGEGSAAARDDSGTRDQGGARDDSGARDQGGARDDSGTRDQGGTRDGGGTRDKVAARIAELVSAWRQTSARVVAVSDETGLGVVPATPAGRLFRDELGRLNQALAAESEEAELVVAGRVVPL